MRVLWLSNIDLCIANPSASGTWIFSMFKALTGYSDIIVSANITFTQKKEAFVMSVDNRNYYYLPYSYLNKDGTPQNKAIDYITEVIYTENPDLIHIWGTEKGWGMMINDAIKSKIPCLLEMQGLAFFVAEQRFYGGLNEKQIRRMSGLVELIHPQMKIESMRRALQSWGKKEIPMIQSYKHVNTQSEWVRNLLYWIAPKVNTYKTGIILRDSFLFSPLWSAKHKRGDNPILFTTSSPLPYKGLHTTLHSFSLIKKEYPLARLRIAGIGLHKSSWKDIGYIQYLRELTQKLGIENNVDFLGRLDENGLLSEMYNADLFLTSTYVESYCLAVAEALCIGMPCIAPFTSALVDLITSEYNGILYPLGDYYICAYKAIELLQNEQRSIAIGDRAAALQRDKSNPERIALNQERIYYEVAKSSNEKTRQV